MCVKVNRRRLFRSLDDVLGVTEDEVLYSHHQPLAYMGRLAVVVFLRKTGRDALQISKFIKRKHHVAFRNMQVGMKKYEEDEMFRKLVDSLEA